MTLERGYEETINIDPGGAWNMLQVRSQEVYQNPQMLSFTAVEIYKT